MEQVFTESAKTGEIVTQFPMASQILKKYQIDFCCGGDRSIGEAIESKQLDKEDILRQINELYAEARASQMEQVNWVEKNYDELIDHIVNVHHAYLNRILPELSEFVTKIYRVHGKNHPELSEVHALFHHLKTELEGHSIEEEEIVFPKIKDFEQNKSSSTLNEVIETLSELETEHEVAGDLVKKLREVTRNYELPDDACKTYQLTYAKLQELESDLFEHIHLENNILFPRLNEEKIA